MKRRCICGGGGGGRSSKYPQGIQKEDLLWAYFVMRMVCEVMGDPDMLQRIKDRNKSGPATMFDLAMMCCATKNPGAFEAAANAAKEANKGPTPGNPPSTESDTPKVEKPPRKQN